MNIFEVLKKDHKTVSELFNKIVTTSNRQVQVRDQLFGRLKKELNTHAEMEEKIFYAELRKHKQTARFISESMSEHYEMKDLLEELSVMSRDDDEWIRGILNLRKVVENHVNHEEDEIFDLASHVLSQEQIYEMGLQVKIEKDILLHVGFRAK
jgi:hemerythrin superfamily protein